MLSAADPALPVVHTVDSEFDWREILRKSTTSCICTMPTGTASGATMLLKLEERRFVPRKEPTNYYKDNRDEDKPGSLVCIDIHGTGALQLEHRIVGVL